MKTKNYILGLSLLAFVCLSMVFTSCDKKDDIEEPVILVVTLEQSIDPILVNTPVTFELKIEVFDDGHDDGHDDVHDLEISMVSCEIHFEADGTEAELTLTEHEPGHFEGTHTFTTAGTYELHFSYMHESEMQEKEFSVEVI